MKNFKFNIYGILFTTFGIIGLCILLCTILCPKETYKESSIPFEFNKVTDFVREGDDRFIVYGPIGEDSNYIEIKVVYELDWCTLTEAYEYCYYFNEDSYINDSAYIIYEYNKNYRLY